jgi:pyruvate/2-oxoglutarate dehydrogenase complex dihydrolipoamide acyltransferase (E2) component
VSLELTKIKGGSLFRKIAMGSWRTAGDPSVYGLLEIDAGPSLKFLQAEQAKTQTKLSIAHLVGKAVAKVLQERPEMNGLIRFSRIYQRKHVDLFYQVNIPGDPSDPVGKAMLSGEIVRKAETLSVRQIGEELDRKAKHIREGGKGELTTSINTMKIVPGCLVRWALNISSFLIYDLKLNLSWAGLARDPFGSIMITNVGSLGIDVAWAPLVPYTRVPLLLTIGAIQKRAWIVDETVQIRSVMRIGITFDHRFMDGIHASVMSRLFQQYLAEPEKYLK